MSKTTKALTVADIEAGYDSDEYNGWGYLGGRSQAAAEIAQGALLTPVAVVDAVVLEAANKRGWTPEQLFWWCNSRHGRHFADMAFTTSRGTEIAATAERWKIWQVEA